MEQVRLAVDIGGTITDALVEHEERLACVKVPTTADGDAADADGSLNEPPARTLVPAVATQLRLSSWEHEEGR